MCAMTVKRSYTWTWSMSFWGISGDKGKGFIAGLVGGKTAIPQKRPAQMLSVGW